MVSCQLIDPELKEDIMTKKAGKEGTCGRADNKRVATCLLACILFRCVRVRPRIAKNQPLQAPHQQNPAIESFDIRIGPSYVQSSHDEYMTISSSEIFDKPANVENLPSEANIQSQTKTKPLNYLSFVSEPEESLSSAILCCVCSEETTGAHSCRMCKRPIHAICAAPEKNTAEGFGSKVVCPLCAKNTLAVENRIISKDN
ncbi:hypothetical protein ACJJTC_019186 [Scirpophaga incertulas]